jgi:hypothetical protein
MGREGERIGGRLATATLYATKRAALPRVCEGARLSERKQRTVLRVFVHRDEQVLVFLRQPSEGTGGAG